MPYGASKLKYYKIKAQTGSVDNEVTSVNFFITLIAGGSINYARYHGIKVLVRDAALSILLLFGVSLAYPLDNQPDEDKTHRYSWQQVLSSLEEQLDKLSIIMDDIRNELLMRAYNENSDFVERLYLEPLIRRGYQNLPKIEPNPPLAAITPRTKTYSLENLQNRFTTVLHDTIELKNKNFITPRVALESLVTEFERLRWQLRNLESHLAYHAQWQLAAVEHVGFYAERNRIAATIREMLALQKNRGPPDLIDRLRQEIDESVSNFRPTTNLKIQVNEDGTQILSVTLYTDIDDELFLATFREGVEDAFCNSAAARKQQFAVDLDIRQIAISELYPHGAPDRGSEINLKNHISLFPAGRLSLTTGAASTHAWVGRNITLGPNSTNRRTLAHEFGHLLGFSDAYLRSYLNDSNDHYGVVFLEWTGLNDNLMGSPGTGRVSEGMIETLIDAYGQH